MNIVVMPGDDIGPEITAAARGVVEAANDVYSLGLRLEQIDVGMPSYRKNGTTLTDAALQAAVDADGVILGPCGMTLYPPREEGGINVPGTVRKKLELYANLRPARSRAGVPDARAKLDVLIARENTEGFYADRNMFMGVGEFMPTPDIALAVRKVTAEAARKIAVVSFELARGRRRKVTVVHKQNVMKMSDGLWLREARAVAQAYPDVELDEKIVDATAALLVRDPSKFDVLMCENMFGDILSDEAAALAGSLGMLPSASLGATTGGRTFGFYEPAGGTAPDIAGKDLANPIAQVLSAALMLRHSFGRDDAAKAIENAVLKAIHDGLRTGDIFNAADPAARRVGTRHMGDAIAAALG